MTNIISTNKLTEQQIKQIRALEVKCRDFDNTTGELWLSNDFNQHDDMHCFFLLFEAQSLQGVMAIFAAMSEPAKISALVLPQCRRNGHFTAMLCAAKEQLMKFKIQDIFFVHEAKSTAGKQMIDKWNASPHHSEYLLVFDKQHALELSRKTDLQLSEATQNDLGDLVKLNTEIFDGNEEMFADILRKSIADETTSCFKASMDGKIIGACSANHADIGLYIYGFGISPAYQRRGFGRVMLNLLTRLLIDNYSGDIMLEVDSENAAAYTLYTTSGFSVKTQYDYFERTIDDIATSLALNGKTT